VRTMAERAAQYVDPGLQPLVRQLGRPSPWTHAAAGLSRRVPPLGAETGRRTGRLFFAATRSTTARSLANFTRAASAVGRRELTEHDDSVDVSLLRTPAGSVADRQRWVDAALIEAARAAEVRASRPSGSKDSK